MDEAAPDGDAAVPDGAAVVEEDSLPPLPPLPISALEGSRVPHLPLISVVHLPCSMELPMFFAMQSLKACSQMSCDSRQYGSPLDPTPWQTGSTHRRHGLDVVLKTGRRSVGTGAREL